MKAYQLGSVVLATEALALYVPPSGVTTTADLLINGFFTNPSFVPSPTAVDDAYPAVASAAVATGRAATAPLRVATAAATSEPASIPAVPSPKLGLTSYNPSCTSCGNRNHSGPQTQHAGSSVTLPAWLTLAAATLAAAAVLL